MSDLDLTTVLDEAAASIQPRSNFDAVAPGGGAVVPIAPTTGGGRPFRRTVAIAAASVMLLGGIAAAAYPNGSDDSSAPSTNLVIEPAAPEEPAPTTTVGADDDRRTAPVGQPTGVERPAERPKPDPEAEPAAAYSAELGETSADPIAQFVLGTAAPGEGVLAETEFGKADAEANDDGRWELKLRLGDALPGSLVTIRVTFEQSDEVFELTTEIPRVPVETLPPKPEPEPEPEPKPEPEPEPEPEPVEFTAVLGEGYPAATPMKQVLHGTATPGSKVLATSAYGHATATAGERGGWELVLKMHDVPAPSAVRIVVTVNTGGPEFEFWVERPAPEEEPEAAPFTAQRGDTVFDGELTKVVLFGTGQPGSGVLAASEHGAEDARVNDKGQWEIHLVLRGIPAGHEAVVRVTNNASEAVYEFVVHQPEGEPEPEPVEFTANAALTESDRTPPVNEYWGTSTAGAEIRITSEYGGAEVSANGDGMWDARIEFPEAPVGETFIVRITSSKGEAVYEFPFTRLPAD